MGLGSAVPLPAAEFAGLMAPLGPFETKPLLAVAVSGGADSMALALLAHQWATARGGGIVALTVDHRLRAAAAAEAAQAGRWLSARGIAHRVLRRDGPAPEHGVQAAARAARYRLLEDWCRENGALHLLVAHHRKDQAETLLLRLARGSGIDGLAAMSAIVERAYCRLLRPLLGVASERLAATLRAVGQEWIADPSNQDRVFGRVRVRQAMAELGGFGLESERLAATAARLGRARAALERAVARLLAEAAAVHPAGFVQLRADPLLAAPEEIGLRALAGVLAMAGGGDYPPRLERLERLYRELPKGIAGGRTLGGCRILPRRRGWLICREPAALSPPVVAPPGVTTAWDGRFRLRLPVGAPEGLALGALGGAVVASRSQLPGAVRGSLPALRDAVSLVAVPALGYLRSPSDAAWMGAGSLVFRPTRPMSGAGFTVV